MGTVRFTEFVFAQAKTCCRCKIEKDRSDFQKDSYNKYGLQSKCRACTSITGQEFKKKNPTYSKEKGLDRYHNQDKEKYNKERYLKYRESFLKRRREYSQSERGRLMTLLLSAQNRSKKKGMPFDLDIEWLLSLYEKQNGRCILTGIEFDISTVPNKIRAYHPLSPSLDRIDPKGSYTKNNTRLVCTHINIALNSFGEDAFEKLAKAFLLKRNFSISE